MKFLIGVLLLGLCVGAQAQKRHDPLNSREVDQMRDSAQDSKKRIDLLIGFSRERVLAIDRLRSTIKPGGLDDAGKIADLLTDLAALIDELDDNLVMYSGHSEDLRRPLRHLLDAEAEFQQKLKALDGNATPSQKQRFAVALENASESLKSSTESARELLADQIEKKGEEKNKEKLDRREKHAPGTNPSDAAHREPRDDAGISGVEHTPPQH